MSKSFSGAGSKYVLDKLFGSRIRVKILKFMFRNYSAETLATEIRLKPLGESPRFSWRGTRAQPGLRRGVSVGSLSAKTREPLLKGDFSARELSKRIQEPFEETKKELTFLFKLGLINKKK